MRSYLIFTALALAAGASAQTPRIAVVDMQNALLQTKDGQKASAALNAKFGPREAEFAKRKQDLQARQDQYRKTESTMSDEAKATAYRAIQKLTADLQSEATDAQADVQEESSRQLGPILEKMKIVLDRYAADNHLTMIVDGSVQPTNLLYAEPAAIVTAQVVALYDKTGPVASPAGAAGPSSSAPPPVRKLPAAPAPAPKK